MNTISKRAYGAILGLAIGDAFGAPVEFKARGSFPKLTEYQGGGEFNLKAGQWTDDTSLALCLIQSFIDKNAFDLKDQMQKFYQWWKNGYMSSTGFCFDIGNTTKKALLRYEVEGIVLAGHESDPATNGTIMRLAPVPIFFNQSLKKSIEYSVLQTKATHGAKECVEASMLLAYVLHFCLQGKDKKEILKFTHFEPKLETKLNEILKGSFKNKNENEIDAKGLAFNTLESALYAFYHFNDFYSGLEFVVNLGEDSDTVGAVYGQIAGAYYGLSGIPQHLIENLYDYKNILLMTNHFLKNCEGIQC